jgi:hypothetical protein
MRSDDTGCAFMAMLVLVGGLILFAIWTAQQESAAYNRLTGAKTTAWDAMFLELRVQDQPKKEVSP